MIQNDQSAVYRQALNKTFVNAFNGIQYFFKTERNGKIQLFVSFLVMLTGFYFRLSPTEWVFIFLCIGAVLAMEMLNSALEHLCNMVHHDYHPVIKIIKDVSAGAVLFTSVMSVLIGLVIFLPKILLLL
ncbi:MAG TPA: diacylglycerol kinase family protein [Parafilimonas sp.]|nr:diacylglycerol kinase family protein [Parafilimonas sp.]